MNRVLIPFHFGIELDLLPNRKGDWKILDNRRIADRLVQTKMYYPELVVSGDCMASIAAHRSHLDLIWCDAHGDFNTMWTTETGNLGGMPLAMLNGVGDQSLLEMCNQPTLGISGSRITHIGGASFDRGERERMIERDIDIRELTPRKIPGHPTHLHIDTDVVKGTPAFHPDGVLPRGVFIDMIETIMPWVEVLSIKTPDPRKDVDGSGEYLVLQLINIFETKGHHNAS